eukprot:gene11241-7810_t
MDVIPVVGGEITSRFHQRVQAAAGDDSTSHTKGSPSPNGSGDVTETKPKEFKTGASGVSLDLATLLTRLWLLGAESTDEAGNVGMKAEAIEEMVEEIVRFLQGCSTPNLATLLLVSQSFALMNSLRSKRRSLEIKQEAISLRLTNAIVEKYNATPDEILGDITLYILHRYGHLTSDSDSNLPVQKEAAAVLCSTLPRAQVASFIRQDSVEKQRQLEEIRAIVWGIRIFNKEEGKTTGVGIEDVHPLVEKPLISIEERVREEFERIDQKARDMLALLTSPSFPLSKTDYVQLREEYHHMRQVLHCLLTVRCMHATLHNRINSFILPKYDSAVDELRELFRSNKPTEDGKKPDAIPKKIVYPKFVDLADAYQAAVSTQENFEEIRSFLDLTLASERSYTTSLPEHIAKEAVDSLANEKPIHHRAIVEDKVGNLLSKADLMSFHAYYTTTLPLKLDASAAVWYPRSLCGFRGFCPVRYAETGLLIPGKINFDDDTTCPGYITIEGGLGKWALRKPHTFAFASEKDILQFAANPLAYLLPCWKRCNREEPGVTLLLGLLDRLPKELYIDGSRVVDASYTASESTLDDRQDASTQTGQIDPYMDHNYRWNEWDLRRQALKLCNLMNMRTHSTQTIASHYRRDESTMCLPPKQVAIQTMTDAATQPPRVVQYLKGLRGTKTSEIEQVQETFQY